MSQLLPLDSSLGLRSLVNSTRVSQCFHACVLTLTVNTNLCQHLLSDLSKLNLIVNKHTRAVGLEPLVSIEVNQNWTFGSKFSHNNVLIHIAIVSTNVEHILHFSLLFTVLVSSATIFVVCSKIRSTLLINCKVMFQENSIEETPTSMATLCHVVAVKSELRGQMLFLTKPYFDS